MFDDVKVTPSQQKILLVTHQFSRTGAPGALFNLALLLQKYGYTIDIISLKDGPLGDEFKHHGISSSIVPSLMDDNRAMESLLGTYDFIVVNTLACTPLVAFFCNIPEKVFWWIHENELLFQQISSYLAHLKLADNIQILSAGKYVQKLIQKYMNQPSEILNISIPDSPTESLPAHNTIRFAQIGLIDGMKGQEIFVGAILSLPEQIRNQCEFYICGDLTTANPDILNLIRSASKIFPCIHLLDSMNRKSLYRFYDTIDCIVVPSRIESMSAVMIEGFMKKKICICSDNTGISSYMENGINGFIFKTNDSHELSDTITHVVQSFQSMESIKNEGRKIYDSFFSEPCFEHVVRKIFKFETVSA